MFQEAGLSTLQYVFPMRVVKSFCTHFFTAEMKAFLEFFLNEAEFFSDEVSGKYREAVSDFEVLTVQIGKFEEDLKAEEYSAIIPLKRQVTDGKLTEKDKKAAGQAIKKVNQGADRIIQQAYGCAEKLLTQVRIIRKEFKIDNPTLLINALYLKRNKSDVVFGLEREEEILEKFLQAMKAIAVNMAAVKSGLKEGK
jgi:hypothetical protein